MTLLDEATWEAIEVAALMRQGLAYAAGGIEDQAEGLLAAVQLIWADQARWRKNKKLIEL
jgi:hypothetical protein